MHALHPGFVEGFAAHAEEVARRYPWVRDYTPINEPVTTARFSYLYGHWFPHIRDEAAFLRAVVACAVATAEAMRRIRRHRPDARLIQTEDMGRIFAVPALRYQADSRERTPLPRNRPPLGPRDTATTRSTPASSRQASRADDLAPARRRPLPARHPRSRLLPDVRPLPRHATWPATRLPRTAATDATSMPTRPPTTSRRSCRTSASAPPLREVHAHTGLTLAITEAHAACTREEQVRWLCEALGGGRGRAGRGRAGRRGDELGALRVGRLELAPDAPDEGHYESGRVLPRDGVPRRTAVAEAVAALATEGASAHPVTDGTGWWGGAKGCARGNRGEPVGRSPHTAPGSRALCARPGDRRGADGRRRGIIGVEATPEGPLRLTLRHLAQRRRMCRRRSTWTTCPTMRTTCSTGSWTSASRAGAPRPGARGAPAALVRPPRARAAARRARAMP